VAPWVAPRVARASFVDSASIARFARHITLPEIGLEGQQRLAGARVLIVGEDMAARIATRYLEASGVGVVRTVGDEGIPGPVNGRAWLAVLEDERPDLVVRSGFDDDALLGAARRVGLPVIVMRSREDLVDVLSFPRTPPAAEASLDTPLKRAEPQRAGAAAVVAGTLAAAEALQVLVGHAPRASARHMRVPLDGRPPQVQEIPWI